MDNKVPLISIVIPTYKRMEKLKRLVYSIIHNSFSSYEIIVINDDPLNLIRGDPITDAINITIINNLKNLGVSACRTLGSKLARGEIIFFIDDDNVLANDTLINLYDAFNDSPTDAAVIAPVAYFLSEPNIVWWQGTTIGRITLYSRFLPGNTGSSPMFVKTEDVHNAFAVRRTYLKYMTLVDRRYKRAFPTVVFSKMLMNDGMSLYVASGCKTYHDIPISSGSKLDQFLAFIRSGRVSCDRMYHYYYEPMLYAKQFSSRFGFFLNFIFQGFRSVISIFIILINNRIYGIKAYYIIMCIIKGLLSGVLSETEMIEHSVPKVV